jgi:hypothetical protein
MRRKAFPAVALLVLLSSPAAALDGPEVYQRARVSMVQVVGVTAEGRYHVGSGVSLPNGTVVTNCHVTRRAKRVQMFLSPRDSARLQAADVAHDLCALYFPELHRAPVELSASRQLRIGDRVYAVGFNAGNGLSYQPGEVAELFEHHGGMVIRTTAPFTHGASGGGLFDAEGRLVGILTFFRASLNETHYFAIPVEWLQPLEARTGQAIAPLEGNPFWADAIERQPSFLRAGALEADQRWDELAAFAEQWTQADPSNAQAWVALGKAKAQLGERSVATTAFRRAAELGVVHPAAVAPSPEEHR